MTCNELLDYLYLSLESPNFLITVCIPNVFNVIGRVDEICAGDADILTNGGDENFFPNPGAPEEGKPDKFYCSFRAFTSLLSFPLIVYTLTAAGKKSSQSAQAIAYKDLLTPCHRKIVTQENPQAHLFREAGCPPLRMFKPPN